MFGKFFSTKEVDEYADWIVKQMLRTLPPGRDPRKKNINKRADALDEQIIERTKTLAASTRLNLYKKARLAARLREGMKAGGYPPAFVDHFSMDLMRRLATLKR